MSCAGRSGRPRVPRIAGYSDGRPMGPWRRCRRAFWGLLKNAAWFVGSMAPLMALFPPGKGGGEGVAHGGKGKGVLIHSLTEGHGMPLANRVTPANGDERAQVVPLLDAVKVHTGKRGRPRKRLKV